jgi:hypothetical protein
MKHRRLVLGTAATLAAALPLLAAERLAVRTGLWENTTTLQLSGFSIPAEQLQRLPPEQRAQAEELMRQMGVGAPRTTTEETCITDADLDGRTFRESLKQAGEQCDIKEVAATSKRQEYSFQCSAGGLPANGRLVIEVVDNSHVRGTMETTTPQGRMDVKFESKWKAAACGDAK